MRIKINLKFEGTSLIQSKIQGMIIRIHITSKCRVLKKTLKNIYIKDVIIGGLGGLVHIYRLFMMLRMTKCVRIFETR